MGGGVMWVKWYATVLRQEGFAASVAQVAPIAFVALVLVFSIKLLVRPSSQA